MVACSNVALRKIVGTGAGGFPASTTLFGCAEVSVGAAEVVMDTVAVPDSAGSNPETAVIVTLPGGLLIGATYVAVLPLPAPGVINPSLTSPPAFPFTSQVTAVFEVPVTFAVNV